MDKRRLLSALPHGMSEKKLRLKDVGDRVVKVKYIVDDNTSFTFECTSINEFVDKMYEYKNKFLL